MRRPSRSRLIGGQFQMNFDFRMGQPCEGNVMRLAIRFGGIICQLDFIRAFDLIDNADMQAIGSYDLHVLCDHSCSYHELLPLTHPLTQLRPASPDALQSEKVPKWSLRN